MQRSLTLVNAAFANSVVNAAFANSVESSVRELCEVAFANSVNAAFANFVNVAFANSVNAAFANFVNVAFANSCGYSVRELCECSVHKLLMQHLRMLRLRRYSVKAAFPNSVKQRSQTL